MTSQSTYLTDAEAALKLTAQEREAAEHLKSTRPQVIPDTRAIISRAAATVWFNSVNERMEALGIDHDHDKVKAFCDLAGVPD